MPEVHITPLPVTSLPAAHPVLFVCSATDRGDVCWVHLAGELDIATSPQLQRTLYAARLRSLLIVVDMRRLEFIDTSGLHTIIEASVRARQHGRRLVLVRGPAAVSRAFALTDSLEHVEVADLGPAEPAVQVLLKLATIERAG